MKETLSLIAMTLSVMIFIGQIDPNMTVGELVGMYYPQQAVVEQAGQTTPEQVIIEQVPEPTFEPINNEVPRSEEASVSELPEIVIQDPIKPIVRSYTGADAEALASVIGKEARGLDPVQKRAVGRCVLNRVDDWGGTVQSVANSGAFVRTDSYTEEDLALANEELYNWSINGPRSLPEGYYYFNGNGEQNFFRKELSGERMSLRQLTP